MKHRQNSKLHSSQQSVYYPLDLVDQKDPVLSAHPRYYNRFYPYMLIEDVRLSIMPIGGRTNRKPFRIFVKPSDSKVEKLIAQAVTQDNYRRDLADAVCDFFHSCAQTIMGHGEAVYEIVYFSKLEDGKTAEFELVYVEPTEIIHRQGGILQYVPPNIARELNVPHYVHLPPERILIFRPPTHVQKKLGGIMESLASLDSPKPPSFALQGLNNESEQTFFDSSVHIRTHKLALADAGKSIGWNARNLFQEEVLGYYLLHRQLLFERFKIELRDNILMTLNDGLDRAGKEVGFSGQLVIEGLPTPADVDIAQSHLEMGDQSFEEILESFRL